MLTVSNKEGGGKAPEEEKLNIPNFVRITNTSGFFIPASIINKAWTALSYQIAKRNEAVVRTVDQNFLSFFLDHVLGFQPVPSVPISTMTSYADTVYIANVAQSFTAGIIPGVLWQQTGYQALRTEKPIGEKEGFVDLRIWVEGFENTSLSGRHKLRSPNLPTTLYINIGTTFGQTLWGTDFLYQRMKVHNETITKIFNPDSEELQAWYDSIDTLCCKTRIDGEVPIISSAPDDLTQFVKDNHRFLIQTCLNNDTKECIASMQGSDPNFPNFNNVSKLYYGLEVIPFSSQGFSRLEPVIPDMKRSKAKAANNKRRKAKRKIDGVEQTGEASNLAAVPTEVADINSDETKAGGNHTGTAVDETLAVTHILEDTAMGATEARIVKPVNAKKDSLADQDQTNLHVSVTSHNQDTSRSTAQSEKQVSQLTRLQTTSQGTTLAKNTLVSVTTLTSDKAISVKTRAGDAPIPAITLAGDTSTSVKTLAGNAHTAIAATGTNLSKNAASSQTDAPSRGTASTQTPFKDGEALQATAPAEAQLLSQVTNTASTSSSHTEDPITPTNMATFISEDRARVIAQLRAQPSPPSLEEVRARQASIKEERRQSIEFIRLRTSSRASALGLSVASTAPPELLEANVQGNVAITSPSPNPPRALEQVPELTSNDTNQSTTGPSRLAQPPSPVAQENLKPKRGKWIAPLPELQEWSASHSTSRPAAPAASPVPGKKLKKPRRDAKPVKTSVQSCVSVGTQTDTGITLCSVGTQTETGAATSIAEDLVTEPGPVPSREDESAGHGNAKPQPSFTSCASLQRELELTSIVEDPALEQDRGGQYARGRLTMAAPSTAHTHLVAELTGAGVPPSALTSLSRSGLEANEATGCRQEPVGIRLEVETVTIGGVTFETPRRYGGRHRIAASMPKLELDW